MLCKIQLEVIVINISSAGILLSAIQRRFIIGPQTWSSTSAHPFRQNCLSSAISTTSLNQTLALAFIKATQATVAFRLSKIIVVIVFQQNLFQYFTVCVYDCLYTLFSLHYATVPIFACAVQSCCDLLNAGLIPRNDGAVLNLSAPYILQPPAPQQGAQLFGAPRPERPSAPANPANLMWIWFFLPEHHHNFLNSAIPCPAPQIMPAQLLINFLSWNSHYAPAINNKCRKATCLSLHLDAYSILTPTDAHASHFLSNLTIALPHSSHDSPYLSAPINSLPIKTLNLYIIQHTLHFLMLKGSQ